jgi:hypothetical protein
MPNVNYADMENQERVNEEFNPSAYPGRKWSFIANQEMEVPTEGMSLMDHFAGLAMQGFIASDNGEGRLREDVIANWSYDLAEVMLKERMKRIPK